MHINTVDTFDVIVVGGGPGGVAAAIAAGRSGARVLLLEREGCLGGGATTMLVHPFMPHRTWGNAEVEQKLVNAGIFGEITRRLVARGKGTEGHCVVFDDEALKVVLDEMAREAGVTVLFHAALFDTEREGERVTAALFAHNGGPLRVTGAVFIDGTGDGLLAARAGCEILFGNERGAVMPMTLNFILGGVDLAQIPAYEDIRRCINRGGEDTPALVNTNFSCYSLTPAGYFHLNMIRVGGSTLDPFDVSAAEMDGRARVENFITWARANMPGFAGCFLVKTGAHIGVRENRRVLGDYLLTYADWQACATFDDGIACCAYGIDIHGQQQNELRTEELAPGQYYQIPYRSLTPRGVGNLLIASRCISGDVAAHSSYRIMPVVMNIGEAAGHAAALALPAGDVRAIDIPRLRQAIRDGGGVLEPEVGVRDVCPAPTESMGR